MQIIYSTLEHIFCTPCNIVVDHKWKSSLGNHFSTANCLQWINNIFSANVKVKVYLIKAYKWNSATVFFLYNFELMLLMFRKYILKLGLKYSCFCDMQYAFYPRKWYDSTKRAHKTLQIVSQSKWIIFGYNNHKNTKSPGGTDIWSALLLCPAQEMC